MQQPSIAEVLTSFNTGNVRIRRFWLLVLSVFAATFAWLSAFCYAARLLPMPVWLDQNSQTGSYPITPLHGQNISLLSYVDIFLAFLSGSTLDAVVVVANFNRPLTQQFHYFVSLRMAVLGVLLSISLRIGVIGYRRDPHYLVAVICAIGAIYMAFIVATDKLHTFFPKRYISTRTGSLFHHIQHLGALDMPWSHALVLLALNVVVCFSLAVALPPHWAPLGPPVQIVLEPVFLWIMGADKTARYNIIVAPVVVAYSCLDWGLRQVVMSPRLAISPGAFLMLILAHRLILDLQLCTVFKNRNDLRRARRDVLTSTPTLVSIIGGFFLLECYGMPVVTYIKPILWVGLCVVSMFLHFLPSCYVIVFNKAAKVNS